MIHEHKRGTTVGFADIIRKIDAGYLFRFKYDRDGSTISNEELVDGWLASLKRSYKRTNIMIKPFPNVENADVFDWYVGVDNEDFISHLPAIEEFV